ncbi:hypothetical protein BGZ54_008220 [Gamsiella multidivaricata]|nr:hypothetical protein BGZ54_008220 [Gamsiella multidivaricata]
MTKDSITPASAPLPLPSLSGPIPIYDTPNSPRRSMSPINGAASAMKNFLRRRRGTITSSISNSSNNDSNIETQQDTNSTSSNSSSHDQPLSESLSLGLAQSFVFVGGYGVEPGTTTLVYDVDLSSECDSPTFPKDQAAVLSSSFEPGESVTSLDDLASEGSMEQAPTFSQTMMVHFDGDETLSMRPSVRRIRRSRHRSMTAGVPINCAEFATLMSMAALDAESPNDSDMMMAAATAASVQKRLTMRSISMDSLMSTFTSTAVQGEDGCEMNDAVFQDRQDQPQLEAPSPDSARSNEIQKGAEEEEKTELDETDTCGSNLDSELVWSLDATDMPAESFKLQFTLEDFKTDTEEEDNDEAEQSKDGDEEEEEQPAERQKHHEEQWAEYLQTEKKQQQLQQHQEQEQLQLRQQLQPQPSLIYQNSLRLLVGQAFTSSTPSNSKMTSNGNENNSSINGTAKRPTAGAASAHLQNTLEDLEKEIDGFQYKESDEIEGRSGASVPVQSNKVLLVSNCSSPTQFYDAPQTRYALQTFLASGERKFEEVVEYGFPSEVLCNADGRAGKHTVTGVIKREQRKKPERCRYVTLRVTLTPWHARADEIKLYGPMGAPGKQLQFRSMVHRIFSRSPSNGSSVASSPRLTASMRVPSSRAMVNTEQSMDAAGTRRPRGLTAKEAMESDTATPWSEPILTPPPSGRLEPSDLSRATSCIFDKTQSESRTSDRTFGRVSGTVRQQDKVIVMPPSPDPSPALNPLSSPKEIQVQTQAQAQEKNALIVGTGMISPPGTRSSSPSFHYHSQSQLPRRESLSPLSVPIKNLYDSPSTPIMAPMPMHMSLLLPSSSRHKHSSSANETDAFRESVITPIESPGSEGTTMSTSTKDYFSRRRAERGASYRGDVSPSSGPGASPALQPQQQQQQPRRSSRYPYQLHAQYQEQVLRQQHLAARSPVPSPHPRTVSTIEQQQEYYQAAAAAMQLQLQQQQQRQQREQKELAQAKQGTKLFHFSSKDKKKKSSTPMVSVLELEDAEVEEEEIQQQPRVGAKSWRRQSQRVVASGTSQNYHGHSNNNSGGYGGAGYQQQMVCAPYEVSRRDENDDQQGAEAYFETNVDYHNHYGKGHGREGVEEYFDRQSNAASAAAVGGCWRDVQCYQTDNMKDYAFP